MASLKSVGQAGLFLFRRLSRTKVEMLMLQSNDKAADKYWAPPFGCLCPNEDPCKAAERVTKALTEYVHCDYDLYTKYRYKAQFAHGSQLNHVDFFLANLHNSNKVPCLTDKHCDYKWTDVECACNMAKYLELKKMARCFHDIITNNVLGQ